MKFKAYNDQKRSCSSASREVAVEQERRALCGARFAAVRPLNHPRSLCQLLVVNVAVVVAVVVDRRCLSCSWWIASEQEGEGEERQSFDMLGDQNPEVHLGAGRADAGTETETESDQSAIDGMLAREVGMSWLRRRQRYYSDWNWAERAEPERLEGMLNCRRGRRFPGQEDRSRPVLNDFCDGF